MNRVSTRPLPLDADRAPVRRPTGVARRFPSGRSRVRSVRARKEIGILTIRPRRPRWIRGEEPERERHRQGERDG